ncbi:TRAP transporter small permease subunit [Bacillus sp. B15-48]|uniref:TRAP transporter small permease n=1 Tax=Bacillus sp. B15-48 TaxID=1548601 RepID=UPI00193F9C62|nr:TRAP transporter small permease subunit [Bacillus sp. B15-48]MBM4763364.1 TRAP transporter small permease subunit [Bacillus sp. B15-48]
MSQNQKVNKGIAYIDKGLLVIALICLIISVIGAVASVFFRYVMDLSFQMIEEICRYSIIYGVFAYIGPLIKQKEHLKMSILQDHLKGKVKLYNDLLISVLLSATFAYLLWSSIVWTNSLLAINMLTASGTMLMFVPAFAIPIGMFLGCLYSILQVINDITEIRQYVKSETFIDTNIES